MVAEKKTLTNTIMAQVGVSSLAMGIPPMATKFTRDEVNLQMKMTETILATT